MLKQAFNALTRLHSRAATLKRLGTVTLYSPVRITPSNYFRFLAGPSQTVIHGREFIIPIDSMKGSSTQLVSFDDVPTDGTYILSYNSLDTSSLNFDATASDIQIALRLLTGLDDVDVTGDYTNGFTVVFYGVQTPLALSVTGDMDFDAAGSVADSVHVPWSPTLKRGDKILDTVHGVMAIDEIVEVVDLGGDVMGFRVRSE